MTRNQRLLSVCSVFLFVIAIFSIDSTAQTTYSRKPPKKNEAKSNSSEFVSINNSFKPAWSIILGGGPSLFFGDTRQYRYYPVTNYESEWKFGGSLMLERSISPVFSLRGQALYSGLAGTRRSMNKYFNANLIEFNFNTAINLNNLISSYRPARKWGVYILIGVGLVNFNTTVYELGSNKIISKQGYGYGSGIGGRTLEGLLMGGLGFSYKIDKNWAVHFETAHRALNTDKLDNHVGGFKYDIYNQTSIGLSYTFSSSGKRIKMVPEDQPELLIVDPDDRAPVQPDQQARKEMDSFNRVIDVLELNEQALAEQPETISEIEEKPKEEEPVPAQTIYGIEYRVQIRARYGSKISIDYLAKTYNLSAYEIKENSFNGYYIYTIGSYTTYDEAANKRNIIRSQNGIYDAFVVAFKDGNRLQKLP